MSNSKFSTNDCVFVSLLKKSLNLDIPRLLSHIWLAVTADMKDRYGADILSRLQLSTIKSPEHIAEHSETGEIFKRVQRELKAEFENVDSFLRASSQSDPPVTSSPPVSHASPQDETKMMCGCLKARPCSAEHPTRDNFTKQELKLVEEETKKLTSKTKFQYKLHEKWVMAVESGALGIHYRSPEALQSHVMRVNAELKAFVTCLPTEREAKAASHALAPTVSSQVLQQTQIAQVQHNMNLQLARGECEDRERMPCV